MRYTRLFFFLFCSLLALGSFAQPASYSALYNNAAFASRTIDLTRPVGSINGAAGTSPSGAVTYSIPISVPPGTNGVTPGLSLVYNSHGGNELLGQGWSLSGLSSITRAGWDTYHYGKAAAVSYESKLPYLATPAAGGASAYAFEQSDAFVIDGAYLYPKNGSYGKDGTTYLTEAESYSVTTSYGNISGSPEKFTVVHKDGTIMQFGHSANSRIMSDDGTKVMTWLLSRIQDINGNYIDFTYDNAFRDFRISEIFYTGNVNTGLLPYNRISFNYVERSDKNVCYDGGNSIYSRYLLSDIEVKAEGALFKTYKCNYGLNAHSFSYLKSIEEQAGDGSKLNDTRFKYGESTADINEVINYNSIAASYNSTIQIGTGDFDGDGLSDFLVCEFAKDPVTGNIYNLDAKIKKRSSTSDTYTTIESRSFPGTGIRVEYGHKKSFFTQRKVLPSMADFNGDGRQDVIISNFNTTLDAHGQYVNMLDYIKIYYANSDGTLPADASFTYTPPALYTAIQKGTEQQENYLYIGDFDGDGRSDFVTMLGEAIYFHAPALGITNKPIAKVNRASGTSTVGTAFNDLFRNADYVYVVNMDGDAKNELMVVSGAVTRIFTFNFDAVLYDLHLDQIGNDLDYPTANDNINLGDFNGDGKTDVLTGPQRDLGSTGTWTVGYFSGKKFNKTPFVFDHLIKDYDPQFGGGTDRLLIGDYNGDGKADILNIYEATPGAADVLNMYYSKGESFELKKLYNTYRTRLPSSIVVGDYNGDGKSDLYSFSFDGPLLGYHVHTYFNPFSKAHLLERVSDGFNRITQFDYEVLTKGTGTGTGDFFTRGSGETYPVNNVQFPLYVATGLTRIDGIGGTNTTSFKYRNLRVHRAGRGALGFEKATSLSIADDLRTEALYDLNRTYFVPYLKSTKTILNSSNTTIAQTDNTYDFLSKPAVFSPGYTYSGMLRVGGASGYKQQQATGTSTDLLKGVTSVASSVFDAYGNITGSSTVTTGGETFSSATEAIFIATGGSATPNRLSELLTTVQRGSQPAVTTKNTFTYYPNGLVRESYDDAAGASIPGSTSFIRSYYEYDLYGNVTFSRKNISPIFTTPTIPATKYVYDAFGRFVLSEENNLGHKRYFTRHKFWGKPLTITDYNGLVTSSTYNSWGKLTALTVPTAPGSAYTITYSDGWDPGTNRLMYTLVQDPSAPDVKTWYDYLGRAVKVQQEAFAPGTWTTANTSYDARGNVATATNSYLPSEAPLTTTNTYDALNRIQSRSSVYGTTSYAYTLGGGYARTTVTLPDGKVKSTKLDASGKVVESTNGTAGTVVMEYDSRGNPLRSGLKGAYGGVLYSVTNEYDNTGQLSKMTDLDAGTTTYSYNPLGQLRRQTDPKGKETHYQYDIAGRITRKDLDREYITTYTYYGPDKDYRLETEQVASTTDGTIEDTYDYAVGGGLISHLKNTNGTELLKTYGYDGYNRLTSNEFPQLLVGLPGGGFGPGGGSGFSAQNHYDANGYLKKITSSSGGLSTPKVLYEASAMNGRNQVTRFNRVDGLPAEIIYTDGFVTNYYTPGTQDLVMGYDYQNGNMTEREDFTPGSLMPREFFTYDAHDRLTRAYGEHKSGPGMASHTPLNMVYDQTASGTLSLGRITSKSDVGSYSYGGFPQNAVKKIVVGASGVISHETQDISYNLFHKTRTITEPVGGVVYTEQMVYDANEDRAYTQQTQGSAITRQRWYMGDYEMQQKGAVTQYIHYIGSDAGLCGIVVKEGNTFNYYAAYTDHLGSVVKVTNELGVSVAEQNYDPWGRERQPETWDYYGALSIPAKPDWLYRGYTGHEMLPEYGLINMNGRMYDPANGRMLRPDNFVQDPLNTQSYNRYSYCFNNPLKYTDPSGQVVFVLPSIGFDGGGNLNIGVTVGVGIPGVSSLQGTIGHDFGSNNSYFTFGGTLSGMNASVGWGTKTGFTAGVGLGVGLGIKGIGSNMTSAGIGWTQHGGLYGYGGGMTFSKGQSRFNPTVNFTYGFTIWRMDMGGEPSSPDIRSTKDGYESETVEVMAYRNIMHSGLWEHNNSYNWDNAKTTLDYTGGAFGALQTTVKPGNQWLGKNGKYYNNSWGGNRYTGGRSGAFKAANAYRWAGVGTVVATGVIGGIETYNGYQMDGGHFGYNANSALYQTVGGIGGGWLGAEGGAAIGAGIGVWFGGVGAVPGAVIGGFVGGILGGWGGSSIGGGAVNWYYGR